MIIKFRRIRQESLLGSPVRLFIVIEVHSNCTEVPLVFILTYLHPVGNTSMVQTTDNLITYKYFIHAASHIGPGVTTYQRDVDERGDDNARGLADPDFFLI